MSSKSPIREPRPDRPDDSEGRRPHVELLMASPRGFCAGVRRAIDAVRDAIRIHGAPVYVRRAIVHNTDVVRSLEVEGAVFVQELDEIPDGAVVILSAHGVSPSVAAAANNRPLRIYDAVCPLVAKVHREVERHQKNGRVIVLVGHRGHPEIEGTIGHIDGSDVHIVKDSDEAARLAIPASAAVGYAIQTTYSVPEAARIVAELKRKFSDLAGPSTSDICYATTNRQSAVLEIAGQVDSVIVVGADFSSNANRLAEVARTRCLRVQLIAAPDDLDWSILPGDGGSIGITAAASTPESAVEKVVATLQQQFRTDIKTIETAREDTVFKRLSMG